MKILIIEDDIHQAKNLGEWLEEKDHTVDYAYDGVTGCHQALVDDFDAIVLDWNLPGMAGPEVCRNLRSQSKDRRTPILMLTARETFEDEALATKAGVDDFLIKPAKQEKVEMRLNALVRLANPPKNRVLKVGTLRFEPPDNVSRGGKAIELNPIGLKLLECLMESSPNVVRRVELERQVWGEELPDSDSLRVHIHSLRAMIDKPFDSKMIQTRHGIGYRLVDPDAVSE